MNPELLAKLLGHYRSAAERAGYQFKCLSEDGTADDALEIEGNDGEVTVRIQGPMDGFFGCSAMDIIARLDKEKPKMVNLLIESPGGFVSEGIALYTDLRARAEEGVEVKAECRGVVASAAVLPYLAADVRTMGDGAMLMVHNPWAFMMAMGDKEDIEKTTGAILNGLTAHTENYADILAKRTGMDREEAAKAMAEETWYSSERAINSGFAATVASHVVSDGDRTRMVRAQQDLAANILRRFKG